MGSELNVGNFILDVTDKPSGVEMSAAVRSRILCDILCHNSYYFTTVYNKNLLRNFDKYKAANRFSSKSKIINIYDYYQKINEKHTIIKLKDLPFRVVQIEGSKDYRGYDEAGNFAAYICVDPIDKSKINFVNYLKDGKPYRRDQYSVSGALSRTELLSKPTEAITEIYYDVHANPVIIKEYIVNDKIPKLENIQLNHHGALLKSFESQDDFFCFWFKEMVKKYEIEIALVDRVLEFYGPLRKVKEDFYPKLKVVPVVHSSHTKGDPMAADLTQFYDQPFQEMSKQDGVIVLTNRQKEDIEQRFGKGKIFVLPHAHNIPKDRRHIKLNPNLEKKLPKKIVQVARFSPEKQHLKAIDIYEKVLKKNPDVVVELYGFGETQTEIEKKITEKGLGKNITIQGFSTDVDDVFLNADLSVITSSVEGFCLAIQESLANGCPVVCFDIKYGPSEMIVNGENGILIPIGKDDLMVNAIVSLLKDNELLEQMGRRAISLSENFSEQSLSKEWSKGLNSINGDQN